ncbi:unnamed protein product [Paramecium pentaurelia]|uniref:Transmembrane protein n=1 Tax=Paramecium pentaurelia TaxID=43138 RepID=A0A8S1YET4_9CILI|nr:unnamed protein product [Paramecium pentaurelia]
MYKIFILKILKLLILILSTQPQFNFKDKLKYSLNLNLNNISKYINQKKLIAQLWIKFIHIFNCRYQIKLFFWRCNNGIKFNFATNSTDYIINIFAKTILMNYIKFFNNSVYAIYLLLNNIIHSFPKDEIVRIDNLKNIFQIISQMRNSYLQAETIKIKNCQVENSSGKNGVGFTQKIQKKIQKQQMLLLKI